MFAFTRILEIFLIIFILIIVLVFLSPNIFELWFPDVSVQYSVLTNNGFFGSLYWNWCCSSIGRIMGLIWINLWLKFISIIGLNSIYGLIIYRLISFSIILFSFYLLIRFLYSSKISKITAILLSLNIFFIYIYVIKADVINLIFDVGLSLYGIPIAYTFLFIIYSLKIHKINHPKRIDLFLFYFFLLLYLNSVYAHLVTGGLILYFTLFTKENFFKHLKRPYFSFKNIFFHNFFRENYNYLLVRRTKIEAESVFAFGFMLYLISALINLFSPSLSIREEIWPSDTSFLLGLYNSLPVLEGLIINEWSYYYFLITAVVAVLSVKNNIDISKYSVLLRINLILLAPIIVILTNALAFTSSSLHLDPINTGSNLLHIFENLIFFDDVFKEFNYVFPFHERHIFFVSGLAIVSYCFVGLEIGNLLNKKSLKDDK